MWEFSWGASSADGWAIAWGEGRQCSCAACLKRVALEALRLPNHRHLECLELVGTYGLKRAFSWLSPCRPCVGGRPAQPLAPKATGFVVLPLGGTA